MPLWLCGNSFPSPTRFVAPNLLHRNYLRSLVGERRRVVRSAIPSPTPVRRMSHPSPFCLIASEPAPRRAKRQKDETGRHDFARLPIQRPAHSTVFAVARPARAAAAGVHSCARAQSGRRRGHGAGGADPPVGAIRQLRPSQGFWGLGPGHRPLPGPHPPHATVAARHGGR